MTAPAPRFDAVLFDCDGVLVDSEPITNGVLRDMLEEAGWPLTPAECMHIFLGKAVKDERARIEAHTGRPLTEAWLAAFRARRDQPFFLYLPYTMIHTPLGASADFKGKSAQGLIGDTIEEIEELQKEYGVENHNVRISLNWLR